MALKSGRVGIHPSQVDPITGMLISSPGGTTDYTQLSNKPQINNVTLSGNKSLSDLGIATSLANLQDVTITDPQDGAYLTYDSASSKWVNTTPPPAPVVPEGSTVTPTDDIQKWLNCAGIFDKTSYTTLADVLGDSTTLLALMSDNNAVDYLVRSTTWASGVCANSTAMTDIGANNYCADTLLADSTWCTAICNSTYFESVLTTKVPTMTSDTTPSGTVTYSGQTGQYVGYRAFNSDERGWLANSSGCSANDYAGYEFTSTCITAKATVSMKASGSGTNELYFKIQAYNNSSWEDLSDEQHLVMGNVANQTYSIDVIMPNSISTTKKRLLVTRSATNANGWGIKMQFYGR